MLIQNKIPIYIVHHKPNVDRKIFLEEQFKKQDLYYEFVEDFPPEEIQKPDSDTITVREYSLCLKFEQALKRAQSTNSEYCIIFEDDIILCNSFKEYFNTFFSQFKNLNGDLLMIGTAFNERPTVLNGSNVYYEPRFRTRCAHAIMYTAKSINIVLDSLHKGPYRGYDHKLNDIITEHNLKTCWLEPGLHQGSIGETPYFKFPTSIR